MPLKQYILINYYLGNTVSAKCIKTIYQTVLHFNLQLYYKSYLGMYIIIFLFMIYNIMFRKDIKNFNVTLI